MTRALRVALARAGPVPRGRRRSSARCTSARADDYLLLLEHPHVYTLGTQRRSRARARAAGVASAPSSCAPTAAATSPTTVPASSSATRSSRCPSGATGSATSSRTCAGSRRCSIAALADFGIDAHRDRRATRRVGRRREDRGDRRAGRARADPARLRAQRRSRPRDVRPHRAVRHRRPGRDVARPRCSATRAVDARGRRRGRRALRRARSATTRVERQDVAWRQRPTATTCRRRSSRRTARRDACPCGCSGGSPRPGSTAPARRSRRSGGRSG